jgi:lipoyl(octanoyl) transferase
VNTNINRKTKFIHLGLKDYKEAWDYQTRLFQTILDAKAKNRTLPEDRQNITDNFLLFCQHPHVYTLGKSGNENNLLLRREHLSSIYASYYHINRGGDITYHGPGQIVVYPILDLENFFTDIHKYMRMLEEAVIKTCSLLGISSGRIPGLTGVWVGYEDEASARKISALGVKTSRWVTMHGLAFNVNTDLRYFENIVPCGIQEKAVTSVNKELGAEQSLDHVEKMLKKNIVDLFEMELYD